MPIQRIGRYDPAFCRAHPAWLIVFGDNLLRVGKGGQAIIRDEPNAVGIPTKRAPSMRASAFLTDADWPLVRDAAAGSFARLAAHLGAGGIVVWPTDGIGTGLAELPVRAPLIWAALERARTRLERIGPAPTSSERGE